jgi:hypothetical protein
MPTQTLWLQYGRGRRQIMWRWGYALITSWGQGLGSRAAIGQADRHRMTQQKLVISVTWA